MAVCIEWWTWKTQDNSRKDASIDEEVWSEKETNETSTQPNWNLSQFKPIYENHIVFERYI
jgi:hypothetical protein